MIHRYQSTNILRITYSRDKKNRTSAEVTHWNFQEIPVENCMFSFMKFFLILTELIFNNISRQCNNLFDRNLNLPFKNQLRLIATMESQVLKKKYSRSIYPKYARTVLYTYPFKNGVVVSCMEPSAREARDSQSVDLCTA